MGWAKLRGKREPSNCTVGKEKVAVNWRPWYKSRVIKGKSGQRAERKRKIGKDSMGWV
jgi:hypothetical protein